MHECKRLGGDAIFADGNGECGVVFQQERASRDRRRRLFPNDVLQLAIAEVDDDRCAPAEPEVGSLSLPSLSTFFCSSSSK
jgi:hypothetical protein